MAGLIETSDIASHIGANQHINLSTARLIELALRNREGELAANGALVAYTGKRTGRSPKDKFIVKDAITAQRVAWGNVNQPFDPNKFQTLLERVQQYLRGKDVYIQDLYCGADTRYRLPIRVVTLHAWHSLFVKNLFVRPSARELLSHRPEFTVIAAPDLEAVPSRDGTNSGTFIITDFTRKLVLIGGTHYAGEMKKAIFGVMNFLLPQRDVFPMHCSANVGSDNVTALFFGLSGTGKTTLSTDPQRRLIGDDEHGWGSHGVFNFEGGCYAKCIRLSKRFEPQIWNAIRFGAVLENVTLDPETRLPNYDDDSRTENTRAAYPMDFIEHAIIPGMGGHPKHILFLTADAFGVLPPISRLTEEQALYHFLSGYTAKIAGTEAGMGKEPEPNFSTCFGAPFLPLPPKVYAEMLSRRMREHKVQCWLLNTGWQGGAYGVGHRINLPYTRAMVHAVLDNHLDHIQYEIEPAFGFSIPKSCPDVPANILNPMQSWQSPEAYRAQAASLANRFEENFKKFDVPDAIRNAGPKARY